MNEATTTAIVPVNSDATGFTDGMGQNYTVEVQSDVYLYIERRDPTWTLLVGRWSSTPIVYPGEGYFEVEEAIFTPDPTNPAVIVAVRRGDTVARLPRWLP